MARRVAGSFLADASFSRRRVSSPCPATALRPTRPLSPLPIVISSAGLAGSFYTSELSLTNRGTTTATVRFTYTAAFGGGGGSATDTLAAGRQKTVRGRHPVPHLDRPPDSRRRATAAACCDSTSRISRAPTRDPPPCGRRRRCPAAGPDSRTPPSPAESAAPPISAASVRTTPTARTWRSSTREPPAAGTSSSASRSSPGDPAAPASRVLPDLTLAPGAFTQYTEILKERGPRQGLRPDRPRSRAARPTTRTRRSSTRPPPTARSCPRSREEDIWGPAGLTLPVVVETSVFTTEVVLCNVSTAAATVRLSYVADAIQTADSTASISITLAAGEQKVIPSFVQYLRSQGVAGVGAPGPTFAGALYLTVTGGGPGRRLPGRPDADRGRRRTLRPLLHGPRATARPPRRPRGSTASSRTPRTARTSRSSTRARRTRARSASTSTSTTAPPGRSRSRSTSRWRRRSGRRSTRCCRPGSRTATRASRGRAARTRSSPTRSSSTAARPRRRSDDGAFVEPPGAGAAAPPRAPRDPEGRGEGEEPRRPGRLDARLRPRRGRLHGHAARVRGIGRGRGIAHGVRRLRGRPAPPRDGQPGRRTRRSQSASARPAAEPSPRPSCRARGGRASSSRSGTGEWTQEPVYDLAAMLEEPGRLRDPPREGRRREAHRRCGRSRATGSSTSTRTAGGRSGRGTTRPGLLLAPVLDARDAGHGARSPRSRPISPRGG